MQLEWGVEQCGDAVLAAVFSRRGADDWTLLNHVPDTVDSRSGNETFLDGDDRLVRRDGGGEGEVGPVAVAWMGAFKAERVCDARLAVPVRTVYQLHALGESVEAEGRTVAQEALGQPAVDLVSVVR